MLTGMASNAIMAKARAKYGRCLEEQNFRDMAALTSVGEVAQYLKSRTYYSSALGSVKDSNIHRDRLEVLLRRFLMSEVLELMHFERSIGSHLYECLLVRYEADELMRFMRYYRGGRAADYSTSLPDELAAEMSVDFAGLAGARGAEDIVAAIDDRWLKSAMLNFFRGERADDFTTLEAAVGKAVHSRQMQVVRRYYHGRAADEIMAVVNMRTELKDICHIIRAKRRFGTTPDTLRAQIVGAHSMLTARQTDAIIDAPTADDAMRLLSKTPAGRLFEKYSTRDIGLMTDRIMYNRFASRIRMSQIPAAVMLYYVNIMEYEISNITTIIEGVRYSLPSDRIMPLLILKQ